MNIIVMSTNTPVFFSTRLHHLACLFTMLLALTGINQGPGIAQAAASDYTGHAESGRMPEYAEVGNAIESVRVVLEMMYTAFEDAGISMRSVRIAEPLQYENFKVFPAQLHMKLTENKLPGLMEKIGSFRGNNYFTVVKSMELTGGNVANKSDMDAMLSISIYYCGTTTDNIANPALSDFKRIDAATRRILALSTFSPFVSIDFGKVPGRRVDDSDIRDLPDGTWIHKIGISDNGRVNISGFATSITRLTALGRSMEKNGCFEKALITTINSWSENDLIIFDMSAIIPDMESRL